MDSVCWIIASLELFAGYRGMERKIFWLTGNTFEFWSFIINLKYPTNVPFSVFLGRFDGRALLDFIRDSGSRTFRAQQKTGEEEEVEEFVNFERYRDLIKHRRRGCRYFLVLDSMTVSRDFHFLFLFHPMWWGSLQKQKTKKKLSAKLWEIRSQ